jgi:hypothetical protein
MLESLCFNLTIYVVNFFQKKSTHYFSNPNQDFIVEYKKSKSKSIYAIYTRSDNFGAFFSKP